MSQSGKKSLESVYVEKRKKWSAGAAVAEPQPLLVGDGRNGFSSVSLYIVPSGGSHSFVQVKKKKSKSKRAGNNTPCAYRKKCVGGLLVIHVFPVVERTFGHCGQRKRFVPMDGNYSCPGTVMDGTLDPMG